MEVDLFELLDDSTLLMIFEQMSIRDQFAIRGICRRTRDLFDAHAWTMSKAGRLSEEEEMLVENYTTYRSIMLQIQTLDRERIIADVEKMSADAFPGV